jgi:hypothetical protein
VIEIAKKDLFFAILSCCIMYVSYWIHSFIGIYQRWIFKYGVYGSMLTMLIYFMRLKVRAEGIDPDSRNILSWAASFAL